MRLAFALCLLASAADATERSFEIVAPSCDAKAAAEIASILALELRTTTAPTAPADPLRVALSCAPAGDSVALLVERTATGAHAATVLALADVAPNARPRVIALELAEMIRGLDRPPPTSSATEATPTPPPSSAQRALPPRPSAQRLRVTRNLALSLAAVACAAIATGAVLTARDKDRNGNKGPDGDEAASGVSFSLGTLTLVGSSVNFALWWRDRPRPVLPF